VDVLRGLAILLVVLNHVHMRLAIAGISYAANISKPLIASLVWNGQFGVQIFFAVSGFLITSTALRRWGTFSNISLRDFYLLRFARIAPMLLALLAVLTALHYANISPFVVSEKTGGLGRALLAALTLHVNVLQAHRGWLPANWGVLWSLSVEEMFYLFFPMVALFFSRRNLFPAILLCFVALGPFARTVFARGNDIWSEQSYLGSMDAIALGCLTALLVRRVRLDSRRPAAVLCAAYYQARLGHDYHRAGNLPDYDCRRANTLEESSRTCAFAAPRSTQLRSLFDPHVRRFRIVRNFCEVWKSAVVCAIAFRRYHCRCGRNRKHRRALFFRTAQRHASRTLEPRASTVR
jgi:peptidoglycan/LPS O-acetylase OafA/YrhL